LSRTAFVHANFLTTKAHLYCTFLTELCDKNHTREVARVLVVFKPWQWLRQGTRTSASASPDAAPSHQRLFRGKILRRAYVFSMTISTITKVHFEAQMEMQEWRVVISGLHKEDYSRQN
jgi:hypothetical protein